MRADSAVRFFGKKERRKKREKKEREE